MNLAPNDVKLQFYEHQRLGTQCRRLPLKSKTASINTLRDNFFSHTAPKLYNLVPKIVKGAKNILSFKRKLDIFLMKLPDCPPHFWIYSCKFKFSNRVCGKHTASQESDDDGGVAV